MNSLISEIIIPIFSATIGATIGGIFAYKIAQMRFSSDNTKEGNVGLFAMQIELNKLIAASAEVVNILNPPESEVDAKNLLNRIIQKSEVGPRLIDEMDVFKEYWMRYQHQILRCALPPVTSNKEKREKYRKIHESIRLLIRTTDEYRETCNRMLDGIETKKGLEEYTEESINLVLGNDYWKKIDNMKGRLKSISDTCSSISEQIDKAGYSQR